MVSSPLGRGTGLGSDTPHHTTPPMQPNSSPPAIDSSCQRHVLVPMSILPCLDHAMDPCLVLPPARPRCNPPRQYWSVQLRHHVNPHVPPRVQVAVAVALRRYMSFDQCLHFLYPVVGETAAIVGLCMCCTVSRGLETWSRLNRFMRVWPLAVDNWANTLAFYCQVLKWQKTDTFESPRQSALNCCSRHRMPTLDFPINLEAAPVQRWTKSMLVLLNLHIV